MCLCGCVYVWFCVCMICIRSVHTLHYYSTTTVPQSQNSFALLSTFFNASRPPPFSRLLFKLLPFHIHRLTYFSLLLFLSSLWLCSISLFLSTLCGRSPTKVEKKIHVFSVLLTWHSWAFTPTYFSYIFSLSPHTHSLNSITCTEQAEGKGAIECRHVLRPSFLDDGLVCVDLLCGEERAAVLTVV